MYQGQGALSLCNNKCGSWLDCLEEREILVKNLFKVIK